MLNRPLASLTQIPVAVPQVLRAFAARFAVTFEGVEAVAERDFEIVVKNDLHGLIPASATAIIVILRFGWLVSEERQIEAASRLRFAVATLRASAGQVGRWRNVAAIVDNAERERSPLCQDVALCAAAALHERVTHNTVKPPCAARRWKSGTLIDRPMPSAELPSGIRKPTRKHA